MIRYNIVPAFLVLAVIALTYKVYDLQDKLELQRCALDSRVDSSLRFTHQQQVDNSKAAERLRMDLLALESRSIGLPYRLAAAQVMLGIRDLVVAEPGSHHHDQYINCLSRQYQMIHEGARAARRPVLHLEGLDNVPLYVFEESRGLAEWEKETARQLDEAMALRDKFNKK